MRSFAEFLTAILFSLACFVECNADDLNRIRERGELVWAADQEGGAPYVFPDTEKPSKVIGFEVELAEMVAGELGVKARFQQGQWERLPLLLGRSADCCINGIEMTPERSRDYRCSRPYYAFGLQFLAPKDGPLDAVNTLLHPGPQGPWRVGVLTGSAAEMWVSTQVNLFAVSYDNCVAATDHVVSGSIDAVLQDDCFVSWYADRYPSLRAVGRPFDGGFYTILTSKSTPMLSAALNDALGTIITDGRLKQLYDRWDLAGHQQVTLVRHASEMIPAVRSSWIEFLYEVMPLLLQSAGMTVLLSFLSMPMAIAIGLAIAVGRLYGPRMVRPLLVGYVELVRGTPLMLQLYAIFFLLPMIGLTLPAIVAAIVGLTINYSSYESEIYRAGLRAVSPGQIEAAMSLGMTRRQALWKVVIPQAARIVMPAVTSDFIALFKDTSVCSVVTVIELTKRYSVLAMSTGRIVELSMITAILYLLMSWPMSMLVQRLENRLDTNRHYN